MRVIKPSATYMEHNCTPYEFIEKVARTCYKSEDKITEGSAERMVSALVRMEHMAMLEHETIYLKTSAGFIESFLYHMREFEEPLKYFNITEKECIISGSFRSFYDLFKMDYNCPTVSYLVKVLKKEFPLVFDGFTVRYEREYEVTVVSRQEFIDRYVEKPEVLHKHLTHTMLFVCDRGVSHEFVRHRPASFAQESTRYCCYVKEKFGSEITVILPCFFDTGMGTDSNSLVYDTWKTSCERDERAYFKLIEMGATPQEARTVLPNSLKTELIITATEEEWQHIVNLRLVGTTGAPHPQMREVMQLAITPLMVETMLRVNLDKEV